MLRFAYIPVYLNLRICRFSCSPRSWSMKTQRMPTMPQSCRHHHIHNRIHRPVPPENYPEIVERTAANWEINSEEAQRKCKQMTANNTPNRNKSKVKRNCRLSSFVARILPCCWKNWYRLINEGNGGPSPIHSHKTNRWTNTVEMMGWN